MPKQCQFKHWQPWRMAFKRARRTGFHTPARHRGTVRGRRTCAEQQDRDTGFCSRQRQPPAHCKIENFGHPPSLDHDSSECRTSRRLLAGSQSAFRVARADKNDAVRIETEFGEAGCVESARLSVQKFLPDPENWAVARSPDNKSGGKAGRSAMMRGRWRVDFVNSPPVQPPAKCGIDR